jgi:hypothetical protein
MVDLPLDASDQAHIAFWKHGGIGSTRSHISASTTHLFIRGGTREAKGSSQGYYVSIESFLLIRRH